MAEKLLVVCEANQIRSPLFAWFLQRALVELQAPVVSVSSAGRTARRSETESQKVADLMRERGVQFRPPANPRQLSPGLVRASTMILTMTEDQRAAAIGLDGSAVTRTFTVPELVRLVTAGELRAQSVSELAESAHYARPRTTGPLEPEDVEDPAGRSGRTLTKVADQLSKQADVIARSLTPDS